MVKEKALVKMVLQKLDLNLQHSIITQVEFVAKTIEISS